MKKSPQRRYFSVSCAVYFISTAAAAGTSFPECFVNGQEKPASTESPDSRQSTSIGEFLNSPSAEKVHEKSIQEITKAGHNSSVKR